MSNGFVGRSRFRYGVSPFGLSDAPLDEDWNIGQASTKLVPPNVHGADRRGRMSSNILIVYGSYRLDRKGIRLANYLVRAFGARGDRPELVDAKTVELPILERMYKEHPAGTAPAAMERLAAKIRGADAFVFVVGEYNWGVQPGLKNLTDHFLEEWFWRPAAIASYSSARAAGVRSSLAWHGILSEMGTVVVSSTLAVGNIGDALDDDGNPTGEGGAAIERAFPRFADDLAWWTQAAREQRARVAPPY